jgi:hypothetical protein
MPQMGHLETEDRLPLKITYARGLEPIKNLDHVPSGEETIKQVAKISPTISLRFSCGKDSIGAYLACYGKFKRIIPVHMYLIPDISFVDRALSYYEKFFGTHIYRVPHPSLYRMLRNHVFQPPHRIPIINSFNLAEPSYDEMVALAVGDAGIDYPIYGATGVRATDSPIRYMAVKKHGAINHKTKTFLPVWDWRRKYLLERLKQAHIKIPADYRMFGRTFDGIDHRFVSKMKTEFPKDYQRVLDWFPLAELDSYRRTLGQEETSGKR